MRPEFDYLINILQEYSDIICSAMLLCATLTVGIAWYIEAETKITDESPLIFVFYPLLLGFFIEGPDMMIKSTMATRIGQHHSLHITTKVSY